MVINQVQEKKGMKYTDSAFSDKLKCKVKVKTRCTSISLESSFERMQYSKKTKLEFDSGCAFIFRFKKQIFQGMFWKLNINIIYTLHVC